MGHIHCDRDLDRLEHLVTLDRVCRRRGILHCEEMSGCWLGGSVALAPPSVWPLWASGFPSSSLSGHFADSKALSGLVFWITPRVTPSNSVLFPIEL